MDSRRRLITQVFLAAAYAVVFPLSNAMGGTTMGIGILVTIPFLPVASIAGMYLVQLTSNESFYLFGAFIGIFIQALGCMLLMGRAASDGVHT